MTDSPQNAKPSSTKPCQFIGSMALVVKDYDEAIEWFTTKLDFELICDEVQTPPTKRYFKTEHFAHFAFFNA